MSIKNINANIITCLHLKHDNRKIPTYESIFDIIVAERVNGKLYSPKMDIIVETTTIIEKKKSLTISFNAIIIINVLLLLHLKEMTSKFLENLISIPKHLNYHRAVKKCGFAIKHAVQKIKGLKFPKLLPIATSFSWFIVQELTMVRHGFCKV